MTKQNMTWKWMDSDVKTKNTSQKKHTCWFSKPHHFKVFLHFFSNQQGQFVHHDNARVFQSQSHTVWPTRLIPWNLLNVVIQLQQKHTSK